MQDEYDFPNAERGKFHRSTAKLNLPVYLDDDVLAYFSSRAKDKGIELNQMVNDLLKKDISLIEGVK